MVSRLLSSITDEDERKQLESILTEEEKQNPNLEILEDDEIPVSPDDYCTVSTTFHASQIAKPDFKGGIDEYGVAHIYPIDTTKNPPVYVDLVKNKDFNTKFTNISYGHGSHIANTVNTENGVTYANTVGSPINYNSGGNGRSVRFDFEDDGEIWGDESKCKSWSDNPEYLCSPKGFASFEFTVYVRGHGKLAGKHMACAAKGFGRRGEAGDKNRSVFEMLYPEDTHPKVGANVNYDHFPYVSVKGIQQFFDGDKMEDGKWIGIKWCGKVPKSRGSVTIEEYVDLDPFAAVDGKKNNNWKLKAIIKDFKGVPEYKNIPPTWCAKLMYLRVDGWKSVDIAHGSSYVPIIWEGDIPPTPNPTPDPTPTPTPDPKPPVPDLSSLYIQIIENIIAALSPEVAAKVKAALKDYLDINDSTG